MKVYLTKDVSKVGFAGEILKVSDGYAKNFLFPKNYAVEITKKNQSFYESRVNNVEHRKEALSSEQNVFSEKISKMILTLKKKTHDDNRLYASVNPSDVVELLAKENVKVSKSQIKFDKSIKKTGVYKIIIKLSSKFQPQLTLKVQAL